MRAQAVLPAYAGMILGHSVGIGGTYGAPRVCGDDPGIPRYDVDICAVLPAYAGMILTSGFHPLKTMGCSPRMRG